MLALVRALGRALSAASGARCRRTSGCVVDRWLQGAVVLLHQAGVLRRHVHHRCAIRRAAERLLGDADSPPHHDLFDDAVVSARMAAIGCASFLRCCPEELGMGGWRPRVRQTGASYAVSGLREPRLFPPFASRAVQRLGGLQLSRRSCTVADTPQTFTGSVRSS